MFCEDFNYNKFNIDIVILLCKMIIVVMRGCRLCGFWRMFVFSCILFLIFVIMIDICLLNRGKCFEGFRVLNMVLML